MGNGNYPRPTQRIGTPILVQRSRRAADYTSRAGDLFEKRIRHMNMAENHRGLDAAPIPIARMG